MYLFVVCSCAKTPGMDVCYEVLSFTSVMVLQMVRLYSSATVLGANTGIASIE